jgi:nucleoside-diphosphate-sugar epimerase
MRVLVTGAAGAIGKPVCELLGHRGHVVRRFDRLQSGGDEVIADIADTAAVFAACAGTDAIVHLAATPDRAPFLELVAPNVVGVFNVLDAARQHGVRRVVLASSVQVCWSQGPHERRTAAHTAPRNHYALTKLWAEEMGAMYAREFAISIIAARIGWMVRDEREGLDMRARNMMSTYISRGDVARFMACAIETPDVPFSVFYAMGPGGGDCYDMDAARRAIGFEPQDHFPAGLPFTLPPEGE